MTMSDERRQRLELLAATGSAVATVRSEDLRDLFMAAAAPALPDPPEPAPEPSAKTLTAGLTKPQRALLAEITEAGTLYIDRYRRYHRTVLALERRGLVFKSAPDYSALAQDGWSPVPLPGPPEATEATT